MQTLGRYDEMWSYKRSSEVDELCIMLVPSMSNNQKHVDQCWKLPSPIAESTAFWLKIVMLGIPKP